jgi:hypothetical protein
MFVAMYVFMGAMSVSTYGQTRTQAWRHQHVPYPALFLADAAFFVLLFWNARYVRKLRRQAEADAQGNCELTAWSE